MKLSIYNTNGEKIDSLEVSKAWKDIPLAQQAVKDTVVYHLARLRGGTASAKTRSEVSFSKRKPWRQKGTGRARAGTAGSPIWRKGGVAFGPKPRDFSFKLPKKVRRLALRSVLGEKLRNKEVVIVDRMVLDKPQTKTLQIWLKNLNGGRKPLLTMENMDRNILLSVRNVPGVDFSRVSDLNVYMVLNHGKIIIDKGAWDVLERKVFGVR